MDSNETFEFSYYLDQKQGSFTLDKGYEWVKCNKDFKGFYVTNYNPTNYQNLIDVIRKFPEVSLRNFSFTKAIIIKIYKFLWIL